MKKEIENLDLEKMSLTDAYARTSALFRMERAPNWADSGAEDENYDYQHSRYRAGRESFAKLPKDDRDNSKQNDANAIVRPDRCDDALWKKRGKEVFLGSRTRPGLHCVGKNANPNVRNRTVSAGAIRRPPPVRNPGNGTVRGSLGAASPKTHTAYASPKNSTRRYVYSSADRKWNLGPEE